MKKSIRILALVMVLVMGVLALASCGKTLSGTYSMEAFGTGAELEFSGNKVTITLKALGMSGDGIKGTYKIEDDKITMTFEDEDAKDYSGTFDFEEGEDYIKIGTLGKFSKKD